MIHDFKTGALPTEDILRPFAGFPNALACAKKTLHAHGLLLKAFDAMDAQMRPLASLADGMNLFGFGLGSILRESPEMDDMLRDIQARDQELQRLGAKGLALGLVSIDLALDQDGADGDTRANLCSLARDACIQALPARCAEPWTAYCHQIEIAAAGSLNRPTVHAQTPRL